MLLNFRLEVAVLDSTLGRTVDPGTREISSSISGDVFAVFPAGGLDKKGRVGT